MHIVHPIIVHYKVKDYHRKNHYHAHKHTILSPSHTNTNTYGEHKREKHTSTIELLCVLVRQVLRVVAQVPRHLPRLPGEDHQAGVDQRPGERGQQLI